MMDVLAILAPAAMFLVIGGFAVRSTLQDRALERALAERGWRMSHERHITTFTGTGAVSWQLTQGRNRRAVWRTTVPASAHVVWVQPRGAGGIPSNLGGRVATAVLGAVVGADAAAQLAAAAPVDVGSASLRGSWSVISDDAESAAHLLGGDVEALLEACPLRPLTILRLRDRVELRSHPLIRRVEDLDSLVRLGEALAARAAG